MARHAKVGALPASQSPEYRTWAAMRARCTNPKAASYRHYGGRGISVCERWSSFANFLADMGPRPPGMSIDRYPDNDGNYEPGNCRWATNREQSNNRRITRFAEHEGQRKPISEWARELGANYDVLFQRIRQKGYSLEEATATLRRFGAPRGEYPRGVRLKRGRYCARIRYAYKEYNLGTFDTQDEAVHEINKAHVRLYGAAAILSPVGVDPRAPVAPEPMRRKPRRRGSPPIEYMGQTKNLKDWARTLGIPYEVLKWRMRRGDTVEAAFSGVAR